MHQNWEARHGISGTTCWPKVKDAVSATVHPVHHTQEAHCIRVGLCCWGDSYTQHFLHNRKVIGASSGLTKQVNKSLVLDDIQPGLLKDLQGEVTELLPVQHIVSSSHCGSRLTGGSPMSFLPMKWGWGGSRDVQSSESDFHPWPVSVRKNKVTESVNTDGLESLHHCSETLPWSPAQVFYMHQTTWMKKLQLAHCSLDLPGSAC